MDENIEDLHVRARMLLASWGLLPKGQRTEGETLASNVDVHTDSGDFTLTLRTGKLSADQYIGVPDESYMARSMMEGIESFASKDAKLKWESWRIAIFNSKDNDSRNTYFLELLLLTGNNITSILSIPLEDNLLDPISIEKHSNNPFRKNSEPEQAMYEAVEVEITCNAKSRSMQGDEVYLAYIQDGWEKFDSMDVQYQDTVYRTIFLRRKRKLA